MYWRSIPQESRPGALTMGAVKAFVAVVKNTTNLCVVLFCLETASSKSSTFTAHGHGEQKQR